MGAFLRARRARLLPEDVGVPTYGARRVPGLRREEIAMLAGVSSTYYTRLEQGQNVNASESVLDSLARVLELNAAERAHLFDLARPKRTGRPLARMDDHARTGARHLINSMREVPALILGRRSEVLGWNRLGNLLIASHYPFDSPDDVARRPNLTRMLFLDGPTRRLYARWSEEAARSVASLRLVTGRYPDDDQLREFVRQLQLDSPEFVDLWATHPVENCISGLKFFDHPVVGLLELDFEALVAPDDTGHRVLMYTARSDSASATALAELMALAETDVAVSGEQVIIS
jgi:transcriptional regulator with XRE-family HTH domain